MALINGYTGWASGVNKIILDSTTITVGENSIKTDELESGLKRSRLRGSFIPDKYQVVMEFDWENEVGSTGKTELQLFYDWYKYRHKYGTIPFEFPSILYSPQTGIKIYDEAGDYSKVEYYKITSAVEGSKSGSMIQLKMTWETVFGGVISVSEDTDEIKSIEAVNGYVDVYYSVLKDTEPSSNDFKVYVYDSEDTENPIHIWTPTGDEVDTSSEDSLQGFYFNMDCARVYFPAQEEELAEKTYIVKVMYNDELDSHDSSFTVPALTEEAESE